MQAGILASVPHYFSDTKDTTSTKAFGLNNFILWSLYVAAIINESMPSVRPWVKNRLLIIARDTGIQQAILLAKLLDQDVYLNPWTTISRIDQGDIDYVMDLGI